jgi:putative transposase
MRNVLAQVPRGNSEMVAAAIRTVFAQPDAEHVRSQLDVIAGMLGRQFLQVAAMLREAEDDLLAFTVFPVGHSEVDLVDQPIGAAEQGDQAPAPTSSASFPNPEALLRQAGAVLVEAYDEWQVCDRGYLSETSTAQLNGTDDPAKEVAQPALIAS